MNTRLQDFLNEKDVEYKRNSKIKNFSSIGIGEAADYILFPKNQEMLKSVLNFLKFSGINYKIIGRMSNLLPPDSFYDGALVSTKYIDGFSVSRNMVLAECGIYFPLLVRKISQLNLGGLEPMAAIPGSLGGMVYSNAGAFGTQISDVLINAKVYRTDIDKVEIFDNADLKFAYRTSLFKENSELVLIEALISLVHKKKEDILGLINSYAKIRLSTQPTERSLGSIFKRVNGISAGYYIDKCGLKGFQIGGARVSEKHAGFIINAGDATSKDVKLLIEYIKQVVNNQFRVKLEEEIDYL